MVSFLIVLYVILVIIQFLCIIHIHDHTVGREVSGRNALLIILVTITPISIFISTDFFVRLLGGYAVKKKSPLTRGKRVKLFIFKLLRIKYCPRCLKTTLHDQEWMRGSDLQYGGAISSKGIRCYHCGYIQWHEPLSIYKRRTNLKYFKVYDDDPLYVDGICIDVEKQTNIDLSGDIF